MTGNADQNQSPEPLFRLDAGWLFLLAGVAIVAVVVLISATDGLDDTSFERDVLLDVEAHRLERLERYAKFLDAVDRGEESVAISLAVNQLNQAPKDRILVPPASDGLPAIAQTNASVFPSLEPDPLVLPQRVRRGSTLEHWALNERLRLWLLGGGALCIFIGILPPVRGSR